MLHWPADTALWSKAGRWPNPTEHEVTRLLERWRGGDHAALEQLTPLVYEELRRLAHSYMRREHQGHPLQTTALVHEAYVRLIDQQAVPWQSRAHFLAVSAQAMRHILVDYARQQHAAKRGGEARRVALDDGALASVERAAELVALDDAMQGLPPELPGCGSSAGYHSLRGSAASTS